MKERNGHIEPTIHESVYLAPGVSVAGDVTLEENVSVWHNSVIHGDVAKIVIGARTSIQECCVLHVGWDVPTIIGKDVSIGHGAIVHGCTIEDECLIGMGAIVLDGARIGTGSIVGAGSLVLGGMEVPPHSIVAGNPAKVRRQVTGQEHQGMIIDSVNHYVAEAKVALSGSVSKR